MPPDAVNPTPPGPDPANVPPDPAVQGVRALGVTGLLLAFCGLIALPFCLVEFYKGAWTTAPGPLSGVRALILIGILAGCALSVLLFIGGIGCYALRSWGRPVMLIWAWASIIAGVPGTTGMAWWFARVRQSGAASSFTDVSSCCLVMAWPIGTLLAAWVLYHMQRPTTKAVFAAGRRLASDAGDRES